MENLIILARSNQTEEAMRNNNVLVLAIKVIEKVFLAFG